MFPWIDRLKRAIHSLRSRWSQLLSGGAAAPPSGQRIPDDNPAGQRAEVTPVVGTIMRSSLPPADLRRIVASKSFWYHRMELAPGVTTPGMNDCRTTLQHLLLPSDLSGKRVLDVGAAEGFFSFECEGRGAAEVTALDYSTAEHTGFALCADLLGSKARHVYDTIYNLRSAQIGRFDVILFMGVLYHLPDPLLAFHVIRDLCGPAALVFIETHISDRMLLKPDGQAVSLSEADQRALSQVPVMQYYADDSLNRGDFTNFWGPNLTCLRHMLADAGFEVLRSSLSMPYRAIFNCRAAEPSSRGHLIRQAYGSLLRPN